MWFSARTLLRELLAEGSAAVDEADDSGQHEGADPEEIRSSPDNRADQLAEAGDLFGLLGAYSDGLIPVERLQARQEALLDATLQAVDSDQV